MRNKKTFKVLVADNHPVVRDGISKVIELEENLIVCGKIKSEETLNAIKKLSPDILIIDIFLSSDEGISFLEKIRIEHKNLPILVLSSHSELLYAEKTIRYGAQGYIMKKEQTSSLVKAIFCVLGKNIYLSDDMKQEIIRKQLTPDYQLTSILPEDVLTKEELRVFHYMGSGVSENQIARHLDIGLRAVKTYHEQIRKKLQLNETSLFENAINWTWMTGINL